MMSLLTLYVDPSATPFTPAQAEWMLRLGVWMWIWAIVMWSAATYAAYKQKRLLLWLAWTWFGWFLVPAAFWLVTAPVLWGWGVWALACVAMPCWWVFRGVAHGEWRRA